MVAVFRDPVDTFSPIYSLLPIGTQRFVAGGARHSIIKVFDVRMPGEKAYAAANPVRCLAESENSQYRSEQKPQTDCCNYHHKVQYSHRGWNAFLHTPSQGPRYDSPIYSLSRPSQCSPSMFAGFENTVVQIDLVSIMDQHPDPLFDCGPPRRNDRGDVRRKWDPYGEILSLPMYEHDTGSINLLKQKDVGCFEGSIGDGWDVRWSRYSSKR